MLLLIEAIRNLSDTIVMCPCALSSPRDYIFGGMGVTLCHGYTLKGHIHKCVIQRYGGGALTIISIKEWLIPPS